MSYSTAAQVKELIARLNSNVAINASTVPNLTQTTDIIAQIAAEIDVHLAAVGFGTPVTTPAGFVTWLQLVNSEGAAAIVLKSAFPESVVSQNGGPVIPAYAYYEKKYQDSLKLIDNRTIIFPGADLSGSLLFSTYLSDNPENGGNDGADGFTPGQQPTFSMQQVF